jgi:hypothetical protein
VPIAIMLFLTPFYTWYGLKQSFANDRLIEKLEADPELAKIHHRKTQPWVKGWDSTVHVWPYLLKIEFLAAIVVAPDPRGRWSIFDSTHRSKNPPDSELDHEPVEGPVVLPRSSGNARVLRPVDRGRRAAGHHPRRPHGHPLHRREPAPATATALARVSIWMFFIGFLVLWLVLIVVGTFIRGPGWMSFLAGRNVETAAAWCRE